MKKIYLLLITVFVVDFIDGFAPLSANSSQPKNGLLALSYHGISDAPTSNYTVSEENFKEQIGYLKREGYHSISLDSLGAWLDGSKKLPPKSTLITFDDGNKSDYKKAFPILKEYGFSGNLFLPSEPAGNNVKGLSTQHIKEMIQNGFAVGSHGFSHKSLVGLDSVTLMRETLGSKKKLEDRLGRRIRFFAYPYGNFDEVVEDAVKSSGYKGAFTTIPGKIFRDTNPFELRRVMVGRQFTLEVFKKAINGDNVFYTSRLKGQTSWNIQRGMFRAAKICIDELLEVAKKNTTANENLLIKDFSAKSFNKMGVILLRLGLFEAAGRHFVKAIAFKHDYSEAKKNLDLANRKTKTSDY